MIRIEQKIMRTYLPDIKPKIWVRYVDDIFEIAKKDKVQDLTDHLNQSDDTGNIKFTVEVEEDGKLPMLDVLMHRTEEKKLKTTVYRKKTHTNRYLNYKSHHPLIHKVGVARTLLDRKNNIVMEEEDRKTEDKTIYEALSWNGYPKWVVDRAKKEQLEKETKQQKKANKIESEQPKHKNMVTIPYIQNVSERLAKVFRKYGVSTAMKPSNTIRQILVHPKDKLSKEQTAGVVYKIPCKNCKEAYIGETGRQFQARQKEHKENVKENEKRHSTRAARKQSQTEYNTSALTDHVNKNNHVIDWDSTKFVARESDRTKRIIKEAINIRRTPQNMNRDQGTYTLSNIYNNFLLPSGCSHLA